MCCRIVSSLDVKFTLTRACFFQRQFVSHKHRDFFFLTRFELATRPTRQFIFISSPPSSSLQLSQLTFNTIIDISHHAA